MKMDKLLKQAQKMQAQMEDMQAQMGSMTMEGASGGGMVVAVANGNGDVLSIKISPEVIDKDDPEMLEDLVLSAVNEAIRKCKEMTNDQISKITGGMSFPGF